MNAPYDMYLLGGIIIFVACIIVGAFLFIRMDSAGTDYEEKIEDDED
jgi:hypothetical protein